MAQFIARSERFDLVAIDERRRPGLAAGRRARGLPGGRRRAVGGAWSRWPDVVGTGRGRAPSVGRVPAVVAAVRLELWRLAASVSLAMAEAGESNAGLPAGVDPSQVAERPGGRSGGRRSQAGWSPRRIDGIGTDDPRAVIGIGVNGDWPADAFPADLAGTMTSLRALADGRPIDHAALLDGLRRTP